MIILERIFDFIVNEVLSVIWDSIWIWRILCFAVIFIIIILLKYKNRLFLQIEMINHDKRIFTESNNILNEQSITDFLSKIEFRVIEEDTEGYFFLRYLEFFDQVGNKFLNQKINKSLQDVYFKFNNLSRFIGKHFMDKPGKACGRLFFEPDIKYNDPNDEYDKYFDEMILLRNEAKKSYDNYRLVIKNKLLI